MAKIGREPGKIVNGQGETSNVKREKYNARCQMSVVRCQMSVMKYEIMMLLRSPFTFSRFTFDVSPSPLTVDRSRRFTLHEKMDTTYVISTFYTDVQLIITLSTQVTA
jgi:hypothetical protein